jgi:hypothetical protein
VTVRAEQSAVTVISPIAASRVPELTVALDALNADPANGSIPFQKVPKTHFARLFLTGEATSPHLAYMSDVDGTADQHLQHLVAAAGAGLDRVFELCDGYPEVPTDHTRLAFLRSHLVRPAAMYANRLGITLDQVRSESALHDAIEEYLDANQLPADPVIARDAIRRFVGSDPALSWAATAVRGFDLWWHVCEWARVALVVLVLIALLPVILVLTPIYVILLRVHEVRDAADSTRPPLARLSELASFEDVAAQNPFSGTGPIKPGWFRSATIRLALAGVGFLARHYYNRGRLVGVRTIHFFRLVALDRGRRFIFASTYDGSLESYMDDFIDKVAWGLNAIFSNGLGYPRTSFLFFGGARQEQDFKNWLQSRQVPTPVFFSSYPRLTTDIIAANAAIRAGLTSRMSSEAAAAWLRLL